MHNRLKEKMTFAHWQLDKINSAHTLALTRPKVMFPANSLALPSHVGVCAVCGSKKKKKVKTFSAEKNILIPDSANL
jgi:hypothetical protein